MKNIVITGTSSGIGLELVKLYAKKNCKILSLSRSPSLINNINNVKHIRFDITNQNSIDEIRSIIENEYKVVDILINNAGKLINKAFLDITKEDYISIFDVNFIGVTNLIKNVFPFFNKICILMHGDVFF